MKSFIQIVCVAIIIVMSISTQSYAQDSRGNKRYNHDQSDQYYQDQRKPRHNYSYSHEHRNQCRDSRYSRNYRYNRYQNCCTHRGHHVRSMRSRGRSCAAPNYYVYDRYGRIVGVVRR